MPLSGSRYQTMLHPYDSNVPTCQYNLQFPAHTLIFYHPQPFDGGLRGRNEEAIPNSTDISLYLETLKLDDNQLSALKNGTAIFILDEGLVSDDALPVLYEFLEKRDFKLFGLSLNPSRVGATKNDVEIVEELQKLQQRSSYILLNGMHIKPLGEIIRSNVWDPVLRSLVLFDSNAVSSLSRKMLEGKVGERLQQLIENSLTFYQTLEREVSFIPYVQALADADTFFRGLHSFYQKLLS
jgi:hypothetical protein